MRNFEIEPTGVYASPLIRPPGMDTKVPYEPMLESHNKFFDWVTVTAIKTWYGSPFQTWPGKIVDKVRGGKQDVITGTPGAPLPDPLDARKVAVFGDMGEGSPAQTRSAALALKWGPSYVATVGDNVYPLGREVDWARRFDPQFAELRRTAIWRPALGNHDYYSGDLRPYFNRFPNTAGQAYYTWKLDQAEFFVLDTEQRLDDKSAQRAWLERQLAASTAPYRVIQMHRPMLSTNGGGIARNLYGSLGPLIAKYGVQLVLAGHEHGYERSRDVDGTTYMVVGGGGATTIPYVFKLPGSSLVRTARNHHLELAFDAGRMVVRAVDDRGEAFDTMTVLPHAAVAGAVAGVAALTRAA